MILSSVLIVKHGYKTLPPWNPTTQTSIIKLTAGQLCKGKVSHHHNCKSERVKGTGCEQHRNLGNEEWGILCWLQISFIPHKTKPNLESRTRSAVFFFSTPFLSQSWTVLSSALLCFSPVFCSILKPTFFWSSLGHGTLRERNVKGLSSAEEEA